VVQVQVRLSDSLWEFVKDEAQHHGFADGSEVIEKLIEEAAERKAKAALEKLLEEGLNSRKWHELTPELRAKMLAKYPEPPTAAGHP
jgi:Arc/MetJ-type ribon-helix-helix transcriptional regulator